MIDNGEVFAWALAGAMFGYGCWLWGYGRGVSKGWDSGYKFCLKQKRRPLTDASENRIACGADHYGESEN